MCEENKMQIKKVKKDSFKTLARKLKYVERELKKQNPQVLKNIASQIKVVI